MATTRSRSPVTAKGYHAGRAPANAGKRYPAEILTPAECLALLEACSSRAPTGIRNRALIVVLWRTGLRLAEALALRPKDMDLETGTITVLHGKGDKSRTVGIDPTAGAVVGRWLDRRKGLGLGRHPVFSTLEGRPLKSSYVRTLLPRLAHRVGIEKRVHPHALRHTLAAELMAEGVPVNLIQKQLGHASVATTSRYLDHIRPQQVIDTMAGRAW